MILKASVPNSWWASIVPSLLFSHILPSLCCILGHKEQQSSVKISSLSLSLRSGSPSSIQLVQRDCCLLQVVSHSFFRVLLSSSSSTPTSAPGRKAAVDDTCSVVSASSTHSLFTLLPAPIVTTRHRRRLIRHAQRQRRLQRAPLLLLQGRHPLLCWF
jgi:hypothetical protein